MKKSWSLLVRSPTNRDARNSTAAARSEGRGERPARLNPSPGPSPEEGGEEDWDGFSPPSFPGKGAGGLGPGSSATDLLRQEQGGRVPEVVDHGVAERGPDRPVHDPVVE